MDAHSEDGQGRSESHEFWNADKRKEKAMGEQIVMNEDGELVDEKVMRMNEIETALKAHKEMFTGDYRIGQLLDYKLTLQVVEVGEKLDKEGERQKFQKLEVISLEEL